MIDERYIRNIQTLSIDESNSLATKKVCVVGCGGLGGYNLEMLARIGIGHLTAVDGDSFDVSNLNRQILSNEKNLGTPKADAAAKRIKDINSNVEVIPWNTLFCEENGADLIRGHDVVIDALDNIPSRLLLQKKCEEENIPLIHGAIAGWYGQVTTIFPGDQTLQFLYREVLGDKGVEKELGNPSFIPALIASLQVSETIKFLTGKGDLLQNKVLMINTLRMDFDVIPVMKTKNFE